MQRAAARGCRQRNGDQCRLALRVGEGEDAVAQSCTEGPGRAGREGGEGLFRACFLADEDLRLWCGLIGGSCIAL